MSQPTTSIGFSPTTPAAPAGYQNTIPQSDNGVPFQTESQSVPSTGGVAAKTANYTAVAGDCGLLLSFTLTGAATYTLPATPPSVPDGGGTNRWKVSVQNLTASTASLTISATSTAKLDGTTGGTLALAPGAGVAIFTDGTNYFTERGASSAAGITALTGDVTASGSGSVATTLAASGVTAGTYTKLTVDAKGRTTAGTTLVAADLPATAVTPGSYTNPALTIDTQGRITAASNGAAGAGGGLIQLLQSATSGVSSGVLTATFANNVQPGSSIVVELWSSNNVTGLLDLQGSSYVQYNPQNWSGLVFLSNFVALNVVGGTMLAVSTATSSGAEGIINIYEYSNADSVDASISHADASLTASLTAAFPAEMMHVWGASNVGSSVYSNTGAWPSGRTVGASTASTGSFYFSVGAAGTVSNTLAITGSPLHNYVAMLALKPRTIIAPIALPLSVASGGTGTASPGLIAGSGIALSGTFPNQTVTAVGVGGGGGSLILLEEHTASSSATLAFTTRNATGQSGATFQTDFDIYQIEFVNVIPATNNTDFWCRFSQNGGSTYDNTAGHYSWVMWRLVTGGSGASGGNSDTQLGLSGNITTMSNVTANGGLVGTLKLYSPQSTSINKRMWGSFNYLANSGFNDIALSFSATYLQVAAVNAMEFYMTSGNIASGTVRLYGVAK